jgi:hypothetical protein
MISSISLRLPRKTCGLFDKGYAGGALDVTSLDLSASGDYPYSLEGLKSVGFSSADPDYGSDALADGNLDSVSAFGMDTFDLLEPLADLENDQLMDDSLDAFINLDQYLMGGTFFYEPAEVKPIIEVPTLDNMTFTTPDTEFFLPPVLDVMKPRKRKTETEPVNATPIKTNKLTVPVKAKPVKTSLFEIVVSDNVVAAADPQLDHDYTTKHQTKSAKSGAVEKPISNGNSKGRPIAKATLSFCEPSTSSNDTFLGSEEVMTDKQAVRRLKNNVASKKSREQRKQKFASLDDEAEKLIQANEELRLKIVELEKTAKEMKAMLVAKMTGK